jgi:hypothetical protein
VLRAPLRPRPGSRSAAPYVFIDLSCVTICDVSGPLLSQFGNMDATAPSNHRRTFNELAIFCRGKTMQSNHKTRNDPESIFSFGVRELRQARAARELSAAVAPVKAGGNERGGDPYNTSGSFDRKKNWAKVGKR